MDPASLGIGAASVGIQLFDSAVKLFRVFEEAAQADKKCEQYKLFLRVEYDKLEQWGIMTGLSDDNPKWYASHIRRNGALTVAILSELGILLKTLRSKVLEYRPDSADSESSRAVGQVLRVNDLAEIPDPKIVDEARDNLDVVLRLPDPPRDRKKLRERCWIRLSQAAKDAGKVAKHPKRFKWAISDMEKVKNDFTHVQSLVSSLTDLSRDQMTILVDNTNSFKLTLFQLATDVSEMKALMKADQGFAETATLSGATLVEAVGTLKPDSSSAESSFFRAASAFAVDAKSLNIDTIEPWSDDKLTWNRFSDRLAQTYAVTSDNRKVWIEWKSAPPASGRHNGEPSEMGFSDSAQRVKKLVALLQLRSRPEEFCVPTCIAYIHDGPRFGLVFEPPRDAEFAPDFDHSLRARFIDTRAILEARVGIAQKLAKCLLHLHTVNWLHKGLRSNAILFFPKDINSGCRPQLCGFDFARAADDADATVPPSEDPGRRLYIHPEYLAEPRPSFKRTYDIYSLGVILVEIAFWQPIEIILGLDPSLRMGQIRQVRGKLLDEENGHLKSIEATMGKRYADATRACLSGLSGDDGKAVGDGQDQANPTVAAVIKQAFEEKVVDSLRSILV
ncbi:hypothetical protein M409DRAFT_56933 [Zasmidium cellare ATCC 36951]|uniref:Protein kinase domain-containing protein n=1 Tax=Zasmidium cellare ATCC 36951 TaxID=1080233 RepID=A0A6A6CFR3_ZASCE|nr:uncharacterized protein M409DRAFT_56933 [Zasmidium cellare ATCC 36951]KAF2164246.1 hypothetical protein M409DRAFT_56933 [Zasmidium cellare ATCC 36951]